MEKKFYVTTPIYYVNDVPHLGHTCTTVAADILARYHKLLGEDIFFLTGTDEHGGKVAQAAKDKNLSPQEFCDQVSQTFSSIWPKLNIDYSYFIRTTNPQHEKVVQELIQEIYDKGDVYKAKYEGLYCVGCEKFLTDNDLVEGKCPLHPNATPQHQSEENYFFKLSKYVPLLIKTIEDENDPNHYLISPAAKKEEVLSKLKAGVSDLSISRANVSWGIPIPWDPSQTIYVWFDALINYFSAAKITKKENLWPANLHLIGKEILWFHAVIWEAMLLSAGKPLPKEIFAHSFYMVDGQKMSKSLGNVLSPKELLTKFGVDGTRYLIASSFPRDNDSDVGWEKFTKKYNADLANGLGNLVARVAKLAEKYGLDLRTIGKNERPNRVLEDIEPLMKALKLGSALECIWGAISGLDRYLDRERPWELGASEATKRLGEIIVGTETTISLLEIAESLTPFLPETAKKIQEQFAGPKVKSGPPLFPRL